MKKCAHSVSSHFKKHGIKYILGVSALIVAKGIISLILGVGFFNLTTHASYDPATVCASITDIPQSECYALVDFYNATDGDNRGNDKSGNPINSGWLQGTSVCIDGSQRPGLGCGARDGQHPHILNIHISLSTNVDQRGAVDLTGLPYLQEISLSNFHFPSINISGLSGLFNLIIPGNNLTSLDLTSFSLLQTVSLADNPLVSINIDGLPLLSTLALGNTLLTGLSLSGLADLSTLSLASLSELTSLSLINLPLTSFYLSDSSLITLVLDGLPFLSDLNLVGSTFPYLDLRSLPSLSILNLSGCGLTDLSGLSGTSGISMLNLSHNNLSGTFDASQFPNLQHLTINNNHLDGLNLFDSALLNWVDGGDNQITLDKLMLPDSSATSLAFLYLHNNELSGVLDVSAWPLTSLDLSENHLTQVIMDNHNITWFNLMDNDLTSFDFRGFDNYQGDFWIGGSNQISGTLEEMGICDLPFTGNNVLLDCRNAYNMGEGLACHKIQLNGMNLYGDIPECLTQFNDTLISLGYNYLSLYNSSGEIKYSPELIAWLNDYSVWDSQRGPSNWMNQEDSPERTSDLYILPTITTQGTISKGQTIQMTVNFGTFGPGITIPGSSVLLSFGGLEDVVPSTGSFQTSRGVVGDLCYDQYLQGTGVYAVALDEGSDFLTNAMMHDNGDGTVTVSLGENNGDVTFTPSPATLQTTGLNRYFNFLGDMLTVMGNTGADFQAVWDTFYASGAQIAFEFMCKAGIFNNGEGFATMGECLTSPWSPNSGTPIELSGFPGCGISSLSHTIGGMGTTDARTMTISAKVVGDIAIGASIINAGTELNLRNNYGYYLLNLTTQKVIGISGFLYFGTNIISGGLVLDRDSVATSSGGSVEVPADTNILASGDRDGALYAPMDTSDPSCSLPKTPIKTVSIGASGDNISLIASGGYFKIEVEVGPDYNNDSLAIYVTNGSPCVLNSPDPICVVSGGICSFRASHLSDFSLIVNEEGQNNNQGGNTAPSGGGSPILQKDVCPETRDCSDSYYDKICGHCTAPTLWRKIMNLFRKTPIKGSGSIEKSSYSMEINNAYLWSYTMGITTIPTIQKVNIEGTLLRSHLAKMLSQYATNALGLKENTGANCIFNDMSIQSKEMQYYAVQACRLGLMGVGIKNFSPEKEVDRATFGTTLSRALYGTGNDVAGSKYYTKHLQALKNAGIMTKITNPFAKELRGYVMLMLMRAVDAINK